MSISSPPPVLFPTPVARAIVVGAGISGLTAAFRLRQRGFDVTVLEDSDVIGGKMSSRRTDGFTVNRAANILPSSYRAINALISDLGLTGRVSSMPGVLGVLRDGAVHSLRSNGPGMLVDGLRTPLLSGRSKFLLGRMITDAVRMRSRLSYANLGEAAMFDTETAADYCDRRLNDELREYLVEPIVRALFTSNADRVSVVDFFFAAVNFVGAGFMRYPGGIDFLCRALAEQLHVVTDAPVSRVERDGHGVTVCWRQDGQDRSERVAACVVAVSGAGVPELYPQLDERQREILREHFEYCVTYAAHFGLRSRPTGSAMVVPVPRSEHDGLCVVTFDHNSSPDSVPAGKGLVSAYWLHEWSSARREIADEAVLEEMLPPMDLVVPGIKDLLEFAQLDRWDPAVVRSYPGMYRAVAEFVGRIDPMSRVQLAGDYLSASSTNGCAVSGELAAERVERAVLRTSTLR